MNKRLRKKLLKDVELGYSMLKVDPIKAITFAYMDPLTETTRLAAGIRKVIKMAGIYTEENSWRMGSLNLWNAARQLGTYDIPVHVGDTVTVVNVRKWIDGKQHGNPNVDEFMATITKEASYIMLDRIRADWNRHGG
ncbi:MAG: hypothetical protein NC114_06380 [Ruminococcus flavefaciens]|nr:hypothetical protein [Ruminococcus flavefaciens]